MGASEIGVVVFVLLLIIGLFFLLRGLNLWYWKISERMEMQKKQYLNEREMLGNLREIADLLKKMDEKLDKKS